MAALPHELVEVDLGLGIPARGQHNQSRGAERRQEGAVPVAGVLAQAGQQRPEQRDQLAVRDRDLVPERDMVQADVAHLVAEDEP